MPVFLTVKVTAEVVVRLL